MDVIKKAGNGRVLGLTAVDEDEQRKGKKVDRSECVIAYS